jgi:hypothetical protein
MRGKKENAARQRIIGCCQHGGDILHAALRKTFQHMQKRTDEESVRSSGRFCRNLDIENGDQPVDSTRKSRSHGIVMIDTIA